MNVFCLIYSFTCKQNSITRSDGFAMIPFYSFAWLFYHIIQKNGGMMLRIIKWDLNVLLIDSTFNFVYFLTIQKLVSIKVLTDNLSCIFCRNRIQMQKIAQILSTEDRYKCYLQKITQMLSTEIAQMLLTEFCINVVYRRYHKCCWQKIA